MNPLDLFNRIHRLPPEALTLVEQAVLLALCSTVNSGKGYTGWATQGQLAHWAKVTDRSVRGALASLVAKGMISHQPGAHRGHDFTVNVAAIVAYVAPPTRNHVPTTRNHVPTNPEPRSAPPRNHVPTNPEPRSDTAVSSAIQSAIHTSDTLTAPAVAPTHTEDQNHDDQPSRPPSPESRPDAYRPPDGSGGHAERGGKATERGGPTTDDPPAVPSARGTGPAVAAWDRLDAIRRKNIKGAGTLKLTPAMRKSLGERLKEYSEDDLAAMVEWVTGCRCGSKNCRSCGHLQPGGYTHPQTYLRPDKCSDYVDKATRAGFQSRPTHEEQVDWSESDAARLVVQRVLDTSADIHHRDERILWLAKCTISHMGKRAAWRSKGGTIEWISAWRKEWPASVEAWERKQQQEGAAK